MGEPQLKVAFENNTLKVTWVGDTSKWDAKQQMKAAKAVIDTLEEIDKALHGKKTINWTITGMGKDD
ncbi:hypothetical protein LCGC14_0985020 [marine sediment metagenome]|uniref:Uncharacterized protein n=1 Tax=marine sediment metagenome TaxID=412755 RepID=A0A0F9NTY4_9ZZZZ